MSSLSGIVLVFETQPPSPSSCDSVFGTFCEPQRDSDGHRWDLWHWLTGATATLESNPMGFSIIKLVWSPNVFTNPLKADREIEQLELSLRRILDGLKPCFGFVTTYSNHLEQTWLEEHVLLPLLTEEPIQLFNVYHGCLIGRKGIRVECTGELTFVYSSDVGFYLQMSSSRNPYGD